MRTIRYSGRRGRGVSAQGDVYPSMYWAGDVYPSMHWAGGGHTRLWKHYLPPTSFADGKNVEPIDSKSTKQGFHN